MAGASDSGAATTKNPTTAERTSERELVVRRIVDGPARLVFEAWTRPELFQRWWVPKASGLTLLSCEMDVRVGGKYRLVFRHGDSTMDFFTPGPPERAGRPLVVGELRPAAGHLPLGDARGLHLQG
jgi:hypothetical protein